MLNVQHRKDNAHYHFDLCLPSWLSDDDVGDDDNDDYDDDKVNDGDDNVDDKRRSGHFSSAANPVNYFFSRMSGI